jgi:GntR family transcriptional regulator, transcriptional repressor for pyruvate dehydrogenase complex
MTATWETARRSEKVGERLARQIVAELIEEDLQPGDRLPAEAVMVRQFQVGRATLREALRLLETQGLISVRVGPGGGPVVNELDPRDFGRTTKLHLQMRRATYEEVLEARLSLEPLMARLAAEDHDERGIEKLKEIVEKPFSVDVSDEARWQVNSDEFHTAVMSMSGNSVLDLLGSGLKAVYSDRHRSVTPPAKRLEVAKAHKSIAEAISTGSSQKAERLMRDHMRSWADQSRKLYSPTLEEPVRWE